MDLGIIAAIVLIVLWAVGTFAFAAPGWIHLLLTVGVFVLIWRIVVRGTTPKPGEPARGSRPERR
jgi:hypothetical protein